VYGLYLISKGRIEIQKATPYATVNYATFESGSFFGDDNLLSGRERYTSAVASQDSDVLFIDKAGLATIFARERAIAIHFLWYFWKSLSYQIRESNDQMSSFFAGAPEEQKKEILAATLGADAVVGGRPTHVEIDKKLEVLQTKGLNSKELQLLAKFSNEEIYNARETIFKEGDIGDRLYIVLSGSVVITKQIPGAGEEALAVLKSGDFFGEMALIGHDHRRSADARAEEQGTTVLVITNQALREILSIDTDSAYQFLTILCRILSQRLQEMNEKLYQWRLIAGDFK
jgi:CRP-like cAMP-binding protein